MSRGCPSERLVSAAFLFTARRLISGSPNMVGFTSSLCPHHGFVTADLSCITQPGQLLVVVLTSGFY